MKVPTETNKKDAKSVTAKRFATLDELSSSVFSGSASTAAHIWSSLPVKSSFNFFVSNCPNCETVRSYQHQHYHTIRAVERLMGVVNGLTHTVAVLKRSIYIDWVGLLAFDDFVTFHVLAHNDSRKISPTLNVWAACQILHWMKQL